MRSVHASSRGLRPPRSASRRASPPSTARPLVWKVFGPSVLGECLACRRSRGGGVGEGRPVSATPHRFATRKYADAVLRGAQFRGGSVRRIGAKGMLVWCPL